MAKLKGPLFSLGATQQLGKTLVYFGWKGLNVVREYVIPSNPRTAPQTTQRGYMTTAVAAVHTAQADAVVPMLPADISAYALWASVVKAATTWFNQAVRNFIDQLVAGLGGIVYGNGTVTPGVGTVTFAINDATATVTAGFWYYGTSKTALINVIAAVVVATLINVTIPGLVAGTKYYAQFRPSAPAATVGAWSGIYYGTPT